MKIFLVIFILGMTFPRKLIGEESKGPPKKSGPPHGLSFGVGYFFSESPYKGVKKKKNPIPMIRYSSPLFSVMGQKILYHPSMGKGLQFSLSFNFFEGYEADDSPFLKGMDKRKGTIYAGLGFKKKVKKLKLHIHLEKDALGRHGGLKSQLQLKTSLPISVFLNKGLGLSLPFTMMHFGAGVVFWDEKYTNYYFGVKSFESKIGRRIYRTNDALFLNGSFNLTMMFKKMSVVAGITKSFLPKEVKNSPIVDKTSLLRVFMGISYSLGS